MQYQLEVKGDMNDADYTTSISMVDESDSPHVRAVAKAIKEFQPYTATRPDYAGKPYKSTHHHNWPTGERVRTDLGEKVPQEIYVDSGLVTQEAFDVFEGLLYFGGEYGIHSIDSIILKVIAQTEELL